MGGVVARSGGGGMNWLVGWERMECMELLVWKVTSVLRSPMSGGVGKVWSSVHCRSTPHACFPSFTGEESASWVDTERMPLSTVHSGWADALSYFILGPSEFLSLL